MEIRKGQGVLGKTALSFFYLGTEQSRGRGGGALAGGPWGRGGGRGEGGNGEEAEGDRFPFSPRAEAARGGTSMRASDGG